MRPDHVGDVVDPRADNKPELQHSRCVSWNGVGRLVDIAGRHRQDFQRVPRIKPLGRRQAFLTPVLRERRLIRRRLNLDVGKASADLVGQAWRLQLLHLQTPMPVNKRGDRAGKDGRGVCEDAAPIA